MKRFFGSPVLWLIVFFLIVFRDFFIFGKIPLPIDTLVGSYLPWLDYKWGYVVGVPVKNPLTSDAFSTFFVWKQVIVDMLRHGALPLWNRYSFSGTPLLASFHTASLFPANLLLLLPFDIGWGFFIFFSMLASSLSMYLFLGQYSQSRTGRFIGSLVYALAGPMTTWSQFGTAAWAAALLPLILFCLDRLIITRKVIYFSFLSLLVGLLTFAGHVQLLTYTAVIAPLYFFYRQKTLLGKIKIDLTFLTIFATLIGLGLGAVQLLPSFEFFSHSIRGEENYASTFNYGLSPISEIIRLWAADFFGNPVTINHFSSVSYHEYSSYLGVLTLPLIVSFLISKDKRKKTVIFFIYLFFISLIIASDNPVSRFVFSLPLPLLTYSSASRLFFLTNLSAAVLVGLSIDFLFTDKTARRKTILLSVLLISITLVAVLFVDQGHRLISFRNSLFYIALLTAYLTICVFFKNKKVFTILLILIICFDLSRYYSKYNPFISRSLVFPPTPITDYLINQKPPFRIAREDTNLLPANSWIAYHLESIEGYDPLFNSDYAHYFHRLSDNSYFNTVSRYALLDGINQKFLAASNVKYVLTKNTTEPSARNYLTGDLLKNGYQPVFTDKSVTIFEDPKVKDRAYFVDKLHFVSDKNEMGRILDNPLFDPGREAVILGTPFDLPPAKAAVTSIDLRDNQVKIKTQTAGENFLVLSDAYDPGWKGYVNGKESTIYQVNGALRGVRVPPGDSEVIFKYEPDSFRKGFNISVFSLFILVISTIGLHLTKRQ